MTTVVAAVLSYLAGSVPTGLWLGLWFRGIDIRRHGSRNIGATNALRVLGKTYGAAALAVDILKGLLAVVLIARLSPWEYAPLICGLAAIVGHVTSPFVGFRGGKGVATAAGVFLGLAPLATLVAAAVFAGVVAATRMVSAASLSAAVALVVSVWFFEADPVLRGIAFVVAVLVVVRHRSNIQRILQGTESRLGKKSEG